MNSNWTVSTIHLQIDAVSSDLIWINTEYTEQRPLDKALEKPR